jgi:nucleotide-binding universal stress UspA family protein
MKALWAVEPFHQDNKRVKGMHNLLKQFVSKPAHIEVGFVVTRHENELNLAFDIPFEERFSTYPRKILKSSLRKSKVTIEDKNIHVVDYETFSTTKATDRLLSLAKSRGSDLIALYTHARHGFIRFTLGSFAETAIHRSKISLLLVNPRTNFSPKVKRIFYASDFSPSAKKHLKKVMKICKQLKSDLIVFHQAEVIYKWSLDESNPKIHAYRRKVKRMQNWIEQECKREGIFSEVTVASEFKGTTDLILKNANKEKADLIVVSAKAGPVAALMGGSTTRQVVRGSSKPVLILK